MRLHLEEAKDLQVPDAFILDGPKVMSHWGDEDQEGCLQAACCHHDTGRVLYSDCCNTQKYSPSKTTRSNQIFTKASTGASLTAGHAHCPADCQMHAKRSLTSSHAPTVQFAMKAMAPKSSQAIDTARKSAWCSCKAAVRRYPLAAGTGLTANSVHMQTLVWNSRDGLSAASLPHLVHWQVEASVGLQVAQQAVNLRTQHVQPSSTRFAEGLQLLDSAAVRRGYELADRQSDYREDRRRAAGTWSKTRLQRAVAPV